MTHPAPAPRPRSPHLPIITKYNHLHKNKRMTHPAPAPGHNHEIPSSAAKQAHPAPGHNHEIRRPLFRGATRLRGISSILYPVSSVLSFCIQVFSYPFIPAWLMLHCLSCIVLLAIWLLTVRLGTGVLPSTGRVLWIWGCLRVAMKTHQISSPSPGHQKS